MVTAGRPFRVHRRERLRGLTRYDRSGDTQQLVRSNDTGAPAVDHSVELDVGDASGRSRCGSRRAGAALTPIELPFTEFGSVRALGERVLFAPPRPITRSVSWRLIWRRGVIASCRRRPAYSINRTCGIGDYLTTVRPVEFPTAGGKTAFGLLYPPHNPDYAGPADEKPPLLVKCHGGPTGAASSSLNLSTQFWTSRGIAVLDVNYGGSTGFGREYRERLYGKLGDRRRR